MSPVRSLVNVGSGVADLVLLPIAQYKKDKRLVRGVQKGTTSFVKSTAMEAIKLGARLATGTQVILEQAESVLGSQGQFKDTVTAETLQSPQASDEDSEIADLISKYADQPQDVREGMQSAYRSLTRNFNSAAQTILAVPMEVYERSGNEASSVPCSLLALLLHVSLVNHTGSRTCNSSRRPDSGPQADDRCQRGSEQDVVRPAEYYGSRSKA